LLNLKETAMTLNRFRVMQFACLLTTTATAFAAGGLSPAAYGQAKDQVQAASKGERDACTPLKDNAKDICVQTAKGREKVALAHLQFQHTGNAKDMAKLVEARYDTAFEIAKERCDDQQGNAKDVCMTKARAEHDKAKADARAKKEITEARNDAADSKNKADYKVAAERCDAMSGNAKDACMAAARARYNQ
jgi:membrane protein involved in colicin uptake